MRTKVRLLIIMFSLDMIAVSYSTIIDIYKHSSEYIEYKKNEHKD